MQDNEEEEKEENGQSQKLITNGSLKDNLM